MSRERQGILLCAVSAVGFGGMAIFAKLAYEAEVSVMTLLATRFTLSALLLWSVVCCHWPGLPPMRSLSTAFSIGLVGEGLVAALFFVSLTRIDAALASLLFFTYPALVTACSCAIGRERISRRSAGEVAMVLSGVVLVVLGDKDMGFDGIGMLLALVAALGYTIYILVSDSAVRDVKPMMLSALTCTGAALTFSVFGFLGGRLDFGFEPSGWAPLVGITLLCTVLPIGTFFAGRSRIGPTNASIISTVELPFTLLLAFLLLGERVGTSQMWGGMLILTPVVALQLHQKPLQLPIADAASPAHVEMSRTEVGEVEAEEGIRNNDWATGDNRLGDHDAGPYATAI